MHSLTFRAYDARDRDAVRRLCFDTGLMDQPVAAQYADFESYADIFSSHFTDKEPDNVFVACAEGRIVGCAFGALDVRKMASPLTIAMRHSLTRWAAFQPGTFQFYRRCWFDLVEDMFVGGRPGFDLNRYPSTVQVNLSPQARSQYVARELICRVFDRLAERGTPGVHGETLASDPLTIDFWKRTLGGKIIGTPYPIHGFRTPKGERVELVLGLRALDGWPIGAWRSERIAQLWRRSAG